MEEVTTTAIPLPPGELIRTELKRRNWSQDDLAKIIDKPSSRINELIQGKLSVSPEIATALGAAFGTTGEVWMNAQAAYLLAQPQPAGADSIRRRARLYELGPVKEMQKRGWIKSADSLESLEEEVRHFYRLNDLNDEPQIYGAMRKTNPLAAASPAQRAWAFRLRHVAASIPSASIAAYDESRIEACKHDLRKLAAYSAEVKKVPAVLASYGIRFIAIEGLPGAKVDGFATWLDDTSPVIGLSLKYDRLDNFWFNLGHELIHIQYRDAAPIDGDICDYDEPIYQVKAPMELRANAEGAAIYIAPSELDSFIKRVGPMYSLERINQFANSIKMHPNIIIGQLKGRGEIGHSKHTKSNIPVRDAVVKAAVSDGWGKSFYPGEIK